MATKEILRIGLIGCGSLGLQHARHIESIAAVKLVAVSSHRRQSAVSLSENIASRPVAYDDHREMLREHELDAVLVVTPNHTHCEIVRDAATAAVHVFCEKPLALHVADCDEMIVAARENDVVLMTGYLRRFDNMYKMMKQLIDSGRIGDMRVGHVQLLYHRPATAGNAWVHDRNKYGGLFSFYSHELDQLTWMMGDVTAVQAMMQYPDGDMNSVEESITMNLEFKSGLIGSLNCSRVYPGGTSVLGVAGSKGMLQIIDGVLSFTDLGGNTSVIACDANDAYHDELLYFFDCIRHSTAPSPSGVDGRRTIAIAAAAQESARTGRQIRVSN